MRTFLRLVLASAAVLALSAADGALNGKWQVSQSIAGNDSTQTCTFTQTGNDLAGTCGNEQRSMKFTGKVEEKKVSWVIETEYNGAPLTLKYTGALDAANKITGTVSVEPYAVEGDFSAVPVK